MIYLLMYDISSDAIRSKIANRLVAEGYERIQLSVFTGMRDPKKVKGLWQDLERILKKESSAKFFVLKMTKNNFRNMETIGAFDLDLDYLAGIQNSLFI